MCMMTERLRVFEILAKAFIFGADTQAHVPFVIVIYSPKLAISFTRTKSLATVVFVWWKVSGVFFSRSKTLPPANAKLFAPCSYAIVYVGYTILTYIHSNAISFVLVVQPLMVIFSWNDEKIWPLLVNTLFRFIAPLCYAKTIITIKIVWTLNDGLAWLC